MEGAGTLQRRRPRVNGIPERVIARDASPRALTYAVSGLRVIVH
jgi:hypothetical protein